MVCCCGFTVGFGLQCAGMDRIYDWFGSSDVFRGFPFFVACFAFFFGIFKLWGVFSATWSIPNFSELAMLFQNSSGCECVNRPGPFGIKAPAAALARVSSGCRGLWTVVRALGQVAWFRIFRRLEGRCQKGWRGSSANNMLGCFVMFCGFSWDELLEVCCLY